jgi:S1-C subfamily serine protease
MIRWTLVGLLAPIFGLAHPASTLALPAELVDRGERATALVDVNTTEGRAFGSAFCISDTGIFATDGHVVIASTGEIKLVIRPGEKDQHIAIAHVLGIDYESDLALLQAEDTRNVQKLGLGNSDAALPTQEITAFGYPFGNMLALDKDSYPSVTVNSGKITALRKEKGELTLIQVDALVNPGNSGGPVLDTEGKVIGLVESGVPGAGLNFITPVAKLKKMLDSPLVLIDPPTIDYAKRNEKRTFSIHINSLKRGFMDYDAEFTLTDPDGAVQSTTGKFSAGECDLSLIPTTRTAALKWNPFEGPPPGLKFVLTLKRSDTIAATETGTILLTDVPFPGAVARTGGSHRGGEKSASRGPSHAGLWPRESPHDPLPTDATETEIIGAEKGSEFRDITQGSKLAIGVQYIPAQMNNKPAMSNIRLLYDKPTDDTQPSVLAKDGYAVAGLNISIGHYSMGQFFNGFQVIFMRQKDGKLDPSDSYTSDWAGETSKGKPKQLAGNGARIVGLCGRRGIFIRAIGLVTENAGNSATSQPEAK